MPDKYRKFIIILIVAGLALSALSATSICNFGGCTEAHLYRLFGISFPLVGVLFFSGAIVLIGFTRRSPISGFLYNLLLSGGAAAEINMILLQKNVIKAWCPVCLAIAAVIYLLVVLRLIEQLFLSQEGIRINMKTFGRSALIAVVAILGFAVSFTGIAKKDAHAGQANLYLGKQNSKTEIYLFSDWFCPGCIQVEDTIESIYPTLSQKGKLLFVDKVIHPESANFIPYHMSFAAYEKSKYMDLRKALFAVAKKKRNPGNEDIEKAIAPLKVNYKQLDFLEITQQMDSQRKLGEKFNVNATPTLVVRNSRNNKIVTLVGSENITSPLIDKAISDVE